MIFFLVHLETFRFQSKDFVMARKLAFTAIYLFSLTLFVSFKDPTC